VSVSTKNAIAYSTLRLVFASIDSKACRLSNSYRYDAEIAEAVQRRLSTINIATHWREQSSLWLVLQRRFIYVQGCVSPAFDKDKFLAELAKTADVDKVIDNTTSDPKAKPLPYPPSAP